MYSFPESIEEFLLGASIPDWQGEELESHCHKLEQQYAVSRDPEILNAYLETLAVDVPLYIYGVGIQGQSLVQHFNNRADIEVVGFIDQKAWSNGPCCGVPVTPIERAEQLFSGRAHVIVCHGFLENEMVEELNKYGVPEKCIIRVYTGGEMLSWWNFQATGYPQIPEHIEYLIVSTHAPLWSVIPNQELSGVFPPDKTYNLLFGRFDQPFRHATFYQTDVYRYINLHMSLDYLGHVIRQVKPTVVYLKSGPHGNGEFLAFWIKKRFPNLKLIVEFYDLSALFSSFRLGMSYGVGEEHIYLSRLGNYFATIHADAVITKNGGAKWQVLKQQFVARSIDYYPGVVADTGAAPERSRVQNGKCRIIFGGSLPKPKKIDGRYEHLDLNYWDYFEVLERNGKFEIDAYNAAHNSEALDEAFADYLQKYSDSTKRLRYHRAVPSHELAILMPDYDFGWLVCHDDVEEHFEGISQVAMSNKMASYVQAGIPIVMDRAYEFMAGLVTEFEAGILASWPEREALPDTLLASDQQHLKTGVVALRSHLLNSNLKALAQLKEVVAV